MIAPLFQRPYVWNEDANWSPLWKAIEEQSARRIAGKARPYFLGALVLEEVRTRSGSAVGNRREIIDGQQRLTTIQILYRAAIEILEGYDLKFEAEALRNLDFNRVREHSDERFKVWPTNLDRAAFRAVMDGEPESGRMGEAYRFFRSRIEEYLSAESTRTERASALTETITGGFVFAAIDLDDEDDSQLIFKTLNSLGLRYFLPI